MVSPLLSPSPSLQRELFRNIPTLQHNEGYDVAYPSQRSGDCHVIGYLLGRKDAVVEGKKNWDTNGDRCFRKVEFGWVLKLSMRHQHGKAAPSSDCFDMVKEWR